MSREIKFRAWSKKTKKMYKDVIHVNLNSHEGIWTTVLRNDPFEGKTVHYSIQPEHCELMQFTGLKDKNGKDIYEGDIVKGISKESFYEVIYRPEIGGFSTNIGLVGFIECEVIGNIYETPELLNK